MLEEMCDFFEKRLDGYDAHMRTAIFGASEFYPYTADCLPDADGARILDLGCGTGLELEPYFVRNPSALVTGIDLSAGMLKALREKFRDRNMTLICGSYFDVPFGKACFDAAVSVESLHHFTKEEKIPLYRKLRESLKDGGYLILTDYFTLSDTEEAFHRAELNRLKAAEEITNDAFYHYDTPLTVAHEIEAMREAGFSSVAVLKNWGTTYTLKAIHVYGQDQKGTVGVV